MSTGDLIFHPDYSEQTADTLVLQASDGTCFAFSQKILAKHSSFFAGLSEWHLPPASPNPPPADGCDAAERALDGRNDGNPCSTKVENHVPAVSPKKLMENNDGTQPQLAERTRTPNTRTPNTCAIPLLYPSAPALHYILCVVKSEAATGIRVPFQADVYSPEQLDEIIQTAEAYDMQFVFKWMAAWMIDRRDWPREVIRTIAAIGCRPRWAQVDMGLQREEGFWPLDEWSGNLLLRLAPNQHKKLIDREEAVQQFKNNVLNGTSKLWPGTCRLAKRPCPSMGRFGEYGYHGFVEDALDHVLRLNSPFTGYYRRSDPIFSLCRDISECQKCGTRLGQQVWLYWFFRPSMGLNRSLRDR